MNSYCYIRGSLHVEMRRDITELKAYFGILDNSLLIFSRKKSIKASYFGMAFIFGLNISGIGLNTGDFNWPASGFLFLIYGMSFDFSSGFTIFFVDDPGWIISDLFKTFLLSTKDLPTDFFIPSPGFLNDLSNDVFLELTEVLIVVLGKSTHSWICAAVASLRRTPPVRSVILLVWPQWRPTTIHYPFLPCRKIGLPLIPA